ncbi:MAG: hypothetical protein R2827_03890 [Bdellovibrionales bacterium]
MKIAGFFNRLSILGASVLLVSCITVNVNFPEAAVQKAADDYVKELFIKQKQEAEMEGKSSPVQFLK